MAEFELNGIKLQVPDTALTPQLTQKLSRGKYEAKEARAVKSCVKPGHRVLELGSGVGYISAICSRITGAENVTTVEANPELVELVRQNLARNGHDAVRVIHGAVGARTRAASQVPFQFGSGFWSGRLIHGDPSGRDHVMVPHLGFGALLDEIQPHVVIMDIEGAEAQLFDTPWAAHVDHVILELHPRSYPDQVIARIVESLAQSGLTYNPDAALGRTLVFSALSQRHEKRGHNGPRSGSRSGTGGDRPPGPVLRLVRRFLGLFLRD